jgi:Tfp pilus assembly protein PilW
MRMRGATLIELLFAMLLAGFAMAGALTGLAQAQRIWRDTEQLGRLHERAQYVFSTLEPELQMAGYFGSAWHPQSGNVTADVSGSVTGCGNTTVLPLQPAVRVIRGWTLPCNAQGRGAQPESDVLILRRASTRITAVPDGALQVQLAPPRPESRDLHVRIFYVARAADGDPDTPALRVKSLTAVAGEPAFVDTEVMPGVEALQIELLPDETAPTSVLVRLRVRADAADVRAGNAPPMLALERRFHLRNVAS